MDDAAVMKRAIGLAQRGEGYVEPNPMVGCVIVKKGTVIAEGWHHRFGADHAEIDALKKAGRRARGADVYVTLEPCAHRGKTPPCTDALIAAGVSRVIIGAKDPNAQAAGGIAKLRRAGIKVQVGVEAHAAERLIEPFAKCATTGLPYVIAKWAATLDGATAGPTGDSKWISNERSRKLVHQLRGRVDAVMIGIGTALADDPLLTARGVKVRRVARRVVIDPSLRLPVASNLVTSIDRAPLTIALGKQRLAKGGKKVDQLLSKGVELVGLGPGRGGGLAVKPLLRHMVKAHQATNLLLEGGARTAGMAIELGFVDEIWAFVAPRVFLDGTGRVPLSLPRSAANRVKIGHSKALHFVQSRAVDGDVLLRYRIADR